MKKIILISLLVVFTVFTQADIIQNENKIILGSFKIEENAQKVLRDILDNLDGEIKQKQKEYGFNIFLKTSENNYFIVVVESFRTKEKALEVNKLFKKYFPDSFIVNSKIQNSKEDKIFSVKKPEEKLELKQNKSNKTKLVNSYTLEEMIHEVILTDPEIKERLFQYNSLMEEKRVSQASYYPKVDALGKIGRINSKRETAQKSTFTSSELTLKVVQNIFSGYGTKNAVDRDDARAKAAFNKYLEVAQDKIYRAIEAYIKVIRYKEVLDIAKDNVRIHEETLLKIKKRYDEGFSTLSEVERVEGRLSLAKSNFIAETNNLYDAKFNFHKALGRYVDKEDLVVPSFTYKLPKTIEEAKSIAIVNNPSILVADYDIKAIKKSLDYENRNFYPNLDLEMQASRYENKATGEDGREDEIKALLVLRYNLYNGGADKANKQKYISLLNYEYAHKNRLKRDTIEALNLSWSAYTLLQEQYKYQLSYKELTTRTKEAYTEEFQLGRRTLIDLLDVQDEVNNIRIKVIHNVYDLLFSKYRILDAMGELYKVFGESFSEKYKRDRLLGEVDQDGDKIVDVRDHCDNSKSTISNVYGCEKLNTIQIEEIEFNKNIEDSKDQLDISDVKKLWNVE